MVRKRKIIIYIAASVDGIIAQPGDDLSFLSIVEKEGEDYGYHTFIQSMDTVIIGRKTYDWVMRQVPEFPHADKTTYVITRTPKLSIGNTYFYTRDIALLVDQLKSEEGKNIFIDGGAEIVQHFLHHQLADELILSIIPVLLGSGTLLFDQLQAVTPMQLLSCKSFEKGLVQLHYRIIK